MFLVAANELDNLLKFLEQLWKRFSELIDSALMSLRPQAITDFDSTLSIFIKITTALLLLLAFCYLFWYILNKLIKYLQKLLLIVLGIWVLVLAIFILRGL